MIGVVINYCSNESKFIEANIRECLKFSNDIVVSYGDKLYNGEVEDPHHFEELQRKFPQVKFIQYKVEIDLPIDKRRGVYLRPTAYWHNLARSTGVMALDPKTQWVFLIDADEIPEGEKVLQWLQTKRVSQFECYKIATYWYFKLPIYQAKEYEDSILLIPKNVLIDNNIFGDMERDYTIAASGLKLVRMNLGLDDKPMWHHYSFVRSPEGIAKKLSSWGHRDDVFNGKNINDIVEYIFKDENHNDVVHGYTYNTVQKQFDI
jgi:hypothetical protein